MSTTPRPPQIIPYIFYRDVPAALEFLCRAFGFKEEMRAGTPSGGMHGEASFQGQLVMLGQGGGQHSWKTPKDVGAATMGVFIYLDNVDKHYEVAKAATTAGPIGRSIREDIPGSSRLVPPKFRLAQAFADVAWEAPSLCKLLRLPPPSSGRRHYLDRFACFDRRLRTTGQDLDAVRHCGGQNCGRVRRRFRPSCRDWERRGSRSESRRSSALRNRTLLSVPSPARHWPLPPEPRRMWKSSSIDRKAALQHFGIGQARIGHVRVNRARAVEARTGGRAGAERLVVLIGVVAESEIVHRRLRRAERAKRGKQACRLPTCDTSTLPATTAAGYLGDSIEPSGTMMRIGLRQPAFIGMSSSTMTRNT